MWERIKEIIRKEFYQTLREPRMRFVLFIPPLLQLIIFGYVVNLDVTNSRIAWIDLDNTPASRELLAEFNSSGYFRVVAVPTSENEADDLLDKGKVNGAIRILHGFSRKILRGEMTSVQILVDGTNSNTASLISNYANQIINRFSNRISSEQRRVGFIGEDNAVADYQGKHLPSLTVQSRIWFNPELLSQDYFVPGIVVNIITMVTIMLTAMAIVREKEIGTMEQLMVTPIRPVELILGKTLPFVIVGLADVVLITVAALLIFNIPFRGSGILLMGCSILFLLTTLGVGLFISTVSQTQQQAMMSSFFFFMPTFMLSGFAFPIRNMPVIVQYLTYLNPVRYFIEITRGIFLKGSGINVLWQQMAALLIFGIIIMGLSVSRFRKRVD
ncbi:MAG: ABC transporter permease [Nitrospinae bacterium RIFCSPLOWO2_02_FULL_39_110]|nr:MAG: ABC transporter permease [Nitrospinae bacterium RIFCSPHIGHO2_02_39_11]OGW00707.1 MAG: ABC transporter permease [Nitrospinae bacterium RIFCSPHIGHO2_12_FULL_39_42]OGW02458.1 MAG: ABC transporter permease [Nitrospinae bacterium RIFCSPHIGHO2_02_FULL_39_82]OGW04450.1 MAG: ABC transporter permease [Nitrospinae bacterium RIFCSPLOWO2_02_39_17]OGW06428.1 MAG: ABC transporter permease [Nitrospinae bacterium RIFCSPLOWO2_02_FULL_39_110]OGW08150.1 MAG: ABC transporter permease [Nitrospinae bacteriu